MAKLHAARCCHSGRRARSSRVTIGTSPGRINSRMTLSAAQGRAVRCTGRSQPWRRKYRAQVSQRPFVVASRSEHTRQSTGPELVDARRGVLGDAAGIAEALGGGVFDVALGIGNGRRESAKVLDEMPHMIGHKDTPAGIPARTPHLRHWPLQVTSG